MKTRIRTLLILTSLIAELGGVGAAKAFNFRSGDLQYEVFSLNGHFIAEIDFTRESKARVYEIGLNQRFFKGETKLFNPTSESIHLSDDGESIVLEDYTLNRSAVLHFFHKGKKVQDYGLKEVLPGGDGSNMILIPGSLGRWNLRDKFAFLSIINGAPCYCLWFPGETNWVAWKLSDGSRVAAPPTQQKIWDNEATALAQRVVQTGTPESKTTEYTLPPGFEPPRPPQPALPSEEVSYKFLTRFKTTDDRKRIEALLSAADYALTDYGLTGREESIVKLRGSSNQRALGDRLLREFDTGKPAPPRPPFHTLYERFYVGVVEGTVQFPKVPKEGILIIALVPADTAEAWPTKLRVETLRAEVAKVHMHMKEFKALPQYQMQSRFGFEFNEVIPGEYRIKVLWKTAKNDTLPRAFSNEVTPGPGDLFGESEPATVPAGITVELLPFKCDRLLVK
jgi:hypothetical protein